MRVPRQFYKGSISHIFNRGVAKEDIFRERDDFAFYIYKIKEFVQKYPVLIHAYNILSNHLHYLIEQNSEVTPSKFIGGIHTSVGIHINKKYSRVGHLFQDRFKSNIIESNALLPTSIYVNLNKVLEKLQRVENQNVSKRYIDELLKEAEQDPWSSYGVYLGLKEDGITQTKPVLSLLSDNIAKARKEYQRTAKELIILGYFLKTRGLKFE